MAADLFTRYRLSLTTLSPLHVGSGSRLREGHDFISRQGQVFIADIDQLFRAIMPPVTPGQPVDAQAVSQLASVTLGEMLALGWLPPEFFAPRSKVFPHRLRGFTTSSKDKAGELHEFIKDVFYCPYLPGASLKGAFRSVMLRYLAEKDQNLPFPEVKFPREGRQGNISEAAKHAADNIENAYFSGDDWPPGKAPNYSLWRAFRITDTKPVPADRLVLANVNSFPHHNKETGGLTTLPIDFEALPRGVEMSADLSIDNWLIGDRRCRPVLNFTDNDLALFTSRLAEVVNSQAAKRLASEEAFYRRLQQVHGSKLPVDVAPVLGWLADARADLVRLGPSEMFLAVGRGTGWRSKTLGYILQDRNKFSQATFDRIVTEFNLGKGQWAGKTYFPSTRMIASSEGQPSAPMGWLKVKMELLS